MKLTIGTKGMFGQPKQKKSILRILIAKCYTVFVKNLHVTLRRVNNKQSQPIQVNIAIPGIMKDKKPRGRRMSHNYAGYE